MKLVTMEDRYPVQQQYAKAKRVFILCTVAFFVIAGVNLATSHYEYLWNMLFNIALTTAYGGYLVYYFTALYPFLQAKRKFFKNWENGLTRTEIVYIDSDRLTDVTREHLHFYAVTGTILVKGRPMDRQLLLVDPVPLPMGKLTVTTMDSVVLEYEEMP